MHTDLRTLPGRLTAAIVNVAVRRAWLTLFAAVVVTALGLIYTVADLGIDTDMSNMIDSRLPHRMAHQAYRAAFPNLTSDIVVFTESAHAGPAQDAADQIAASLRAQPTIARSVVQPGGGEFFATNGLLYLSTDELWKLDERLNAAEPFLGTLAHDPSLRGLLATLRRGFETELDRDQQQIILRMFDRISAAVEKLIAGHPEPIQWRDELFEPTPQATGIHRSFVLIDPVLDRASVQPALAAVNAVRGIVADLASNTADVRFRFTGDAVMDSEELVTVADDAKLTTLLSFVEVSLVIMLGLRTASLLSAVLLTLACGLIWTAAFATFFVGTLNMISVCFAVLFIGMGVDFGIQFTMRYLEESDRRLARTAAIVAAGQHAGGALALAAVGAAISFLAFVPTSYRGLAQLGVIASWSMLIAWFLNLTLLPALLSLLPQPAARVSTKTSEVTAVDHWASRHFKVILALTGFAVIGGLWLLPQARFDLNPLNLKDANSEGVAAFRDLANDPSHSPYSIHVLSASLTEADVLANKLRALPSVDKVITLSSFVPDDQTEKLEIISGLQFALAGALEPGAEPTPTIAEEASAVNQFLNALTPASRVPAQAAAWAGSVARLSAALTTLTANPDWPQRLAPTLRTELLGDLNSVLTRLAKLLGAQEITLETMPADLREQYLSHNGTALIQVIPRENLNDNAAMKDFVLSVQSVAPLATDAPVELYVGSRVVIKACIVASIWALLLTLVLHILVLHGVVDALLVAAPLVLAMLLTVATSVLFDIPFNFANIIALPLLIGLNNAYGAYLVVRNHATRDVGMLLASSTPRAVLFSGLTAIASFGVLGFSKHPGMAGMGILISVSLSYAIFCALVVLPAIMAAREAYVARNSKKPELEEMI